jgi:hypothetical protein
VTDVLRASDRWLPDRARRWPAGRSVAAAILAVATVIALAGLAGPGPSTVPSPLGGDAQVGTHLTAVGIDGVVGLSGVKTAPAPSGQRATPGALPALLPLALVVALLLTPATAARSIRTLASQRLPSRRAPPRHAFSR